MCIVKFHFLKNRNDLKSDKEVMLMRKASVETMLYIVWSPRTCLRYSWGSEGCAASHSDSHSEKSRLPLKWSNVFESNKSCY